VASPSFHSFMPGRDGMRIPLHRFVDPFGRWGYLIENCKHDRNGLHVLYNFVLFPDAFEGKDKGGTGLNDMATLMEHNHADNLAWVRAAGFEQYPCWSALWGKYAGETLVIASCGPSLTESLPTLYRRRKEFRLLCVNRSMRAFADPEAKPDFFYFVERRGIPDWVTEVDPQGCPTTPLDTKGVTLIGTPQCDSHIVRRFDPKNSYFGYTELGAMGHVPEIARLVKYDIKAATTVGNAPFIAWKLGFKKIVLVGMDFSLDCQMELNEKDKEKSVIHPTRFYFDKDWNHTHYASNREWIQTALPAIGIGNRCVMEDPILAGHRSYIEAICDVLHYDAGVEVVNASPRGLLKFNCKPLEEALD